jgi:hypothetical protein
MELAFCAICGKQWAALDPGVRFVHGDGRWECAEEVPCFDRRAMQAALDDVWAGLTPEQWAGLEHAFGQAPVTRSPFGPGAAR